MSRTPSLSYLVPHAVRIELVREDGPWPVGDAITSPAQVFELLRPHAERWDREHFLTVLLDGAHHVLGIDDVAVGCATSCPVHPREVFKAAILANAVAIIIAHNHPSGSVEPSANDLAVTRKLAEAATVLGIPLLDHIILTGAAYHSMHEADTLSHLLSGVQKAPTQ